jgi:hypothetical protein
MQTSPNLHLHSDAEVLALTTRWLERAVIGLNLCPFAKGVYAKGQIRFVVTRKTDSEQLLATLREEFLALSSSDPERIDTTLLIAPDCFPDFFDFNGFVARVDALLRKMKLQGNLQVAHFHPDFQFADSEAAEISNFTNRAPFPIFHLLREDSIGRAVGAFPGAEKIYEKNIEALERLGRTGWDALGLNVNAGDSGEAN